MGIKKQKINRRKGIEKYAIILGLFSIFLGGCSASTAAPVWQISHQRGSQKQFDSARLSYPAHDKVNGIGVEMVYSRKNNLRTYLEVHSQCISPYLSNPQKAVVTLKTPEKTVQRIIHRHQGGQRATLSDELQEILVDHLLKNIPVTLELVGYSTTLQPSAFADSYAKMQKAPIQIPLQLPFKL